MPKNIKILTQREKTGDFGFRMSKVDCCAILEPGFSGQLVKILAVFGIAFVFNIPIGFAQSEVDSELAAAIANWERWSDYWMDSKCFEYTDVYRHPITRETDMSFQGVFSTSAKGFSFDDRQNKSKEFHGRSVRVTNSEYVGYLKDIGGGDFFIADCFPLDPTVVMGGKSHAYNQTMNNHAGIVLELPGIESGIGTRKLGILDVFVVIRDDVDAKSGNNTNFVDFSLLPKNDVFDTVALGFGNRKIEKVHVRLAEISNHWVPLRLAWKLSDRSGDEIIAECSEYDGETAMPCRVVVFHGKIHAGKGQTVEERYQRGHWWRELGLKQKYESRATLRKLSYFDAYGIPSPFRKPRPWWLTPAVGLAVLGAVVITWCWIRNRISQR